jgi:hypothetical protein
LFGRGDGHGTCLLGWDGALLQGAGPKASPLLPPRRAQAETAACRGQRWSNGSGCYGKPVFVWIRKAVSQLAAPGFVGRCAPGRALVGAPGRTLLAFAWRPSQDVGSNPISGRSTAARPAFRNPSAAGQGLFRGCQSATPRCLDGNPGGASRGSQTQASIPISVWP